MNHLVVLALALVLPNDIWANANEPERCGYMTHIPRLPKPDDLPDLDFDGIPWSQRPLIPALEREDVCMDAYFPGSATSGTQVIYMDEEIEEPVPIAKLNYQGTETPVVLQPLVSGSFAMLGPEIRKVNEEWFIYITQRQDYEITAMQNYMFEIEALGQSLVAIISLEVVNIDDNAPIIQFFDPCVIPEMSDIGLTNCVYDVTDDDGRISTTQMTFKISSDRNDDDMFHIVGGNISPDWKKMTMTIGLNVSLNYELNALHIFRVTALDSLPNEHQITMMVQVENVEHRVPRWVEIFAVQQFDEKTAQSFNVMAIDGDTGINRPIFYKIETNPEDAEFFKIVTIDGGYNGATLEVKPIDRDAIQRELFPISITAYKSNNESLSSTASVVIIINDVNDSPPKPLQTEYSVSIMEETAQTIIFDEEIGFHDKDLGPNAQYSVHLESVRPPGVEQAFFIAPQVGYQRQTFILGTQNHSMLDFEVPQFQNIQLKVVATNLDRPDLTGEATVNITLINWNDEKPIFEQTVQEVQFDETEGTGFYVGTVKAHDRDVHDRVEHSLLGNAQSYLHIDKDTGQVHVTADGAFDYQRQNEIFVQVRAMDTLGEPYNTETAQLVIKLNDINNTPPRLTLPRRSPEVEENVVAGTVVTRDIRAEDADSTADLLYHIQWDASYATKQGRHVDASHYKEVVTIETSYPDGHHRSAVGTLLVREIREGITIDYEEFDMLYLSVRVEDRNTVIGDPYDEALFVVVIIDLNDNAPVWDENTLSQHFTVRERSSSDVVIGSVLATDIDGPLYNQVRYTLRPRGDTPKNLVKIDLRTGQLTVDDDNAIDADEPRFNLYYTVVASDCCLLDDCPPDRNCHNEGKEIAIAIIDTNNKPPMPDTSKFNITVEIYENAQNGTDVVLLAAIDLDRDDIYNTVRYQIQYAVNSRLRDFFAVDLDTGRVYVHYTTNDVLDRDGDEPQHQIFFTLIDNFYSVGDGNRNQEQLEVLVILLDENDNAPELPDKKEFGWDISEAVQKGDKLSPLINAPDRDAPNTPNSKVGYDLINVTLTSRDLSLPTLFEMVTSWNEELQNNIGELRTTIDMKGFWGTYAVGIRAFDHGDPQQISEEIYSLVINPYNFHDPVFVFPRSGSTVRLARERADLNVVLVTVSGNDLQRLEATDEDGLDAGTVTFQIVGDDSAAEYFHVVNDRYNQGILMLKKMFTETVKEFQQVTIRATDGGTAPGPRWSESSFRVAFVPTRGTPLFTQLTETVNFVEEVGGLSERRELSRAEDPKNYLCEDDCHIIVYKILDGNDLGHFGLDSADNVLYVVKELNRTAAMSHTLRIAASNADTATTPSPESILTVTVNVREANPRPYFDREVYTAGISVLDTINRNLLTVSARHSDESEITYSIDEASMSADPSLSTVKDSAFLLNERTGVLTLAFQPTSSMHGMFEFNVIAMDPAGATDTVEVKVYLISSQNRVFFMFVNTLEQIESKIDFIASTFSSGFSMTCNVDQVVPASDEQGVARSDVTEVRAHFVRDHVPVGVEEIENLRSDTALLGAIQRTLSTELLALLDLVTGDSPSLGGNSNAALLYAVAGLAALLAFMCIVLLVTFIVRTRTLHRQLQALSMTKYGSQDSGLNRAGLAAPGTNKHAAEGSNPIWNEAMKAPDFDALSEDSDDSDLIGIEDLPQFRTDSIPVNALGFGEETGRKLATHDNNFAFNPTPFSPEFASAPIRR
ncbi:cadherin-23-like isoform X1 [Pieris brassicae]|uniref:cadherin-23-like isoform X1 n=1 Tax=Pieris brassicae TaxID=7116 RepID=UPI001E661E08|nr:cadherin-23-like isoform X1 [Pieris brassicae]